MTESEKYLGKYVKYKGKVARIIGYVDRPMIVVEVIEGTSLDSEHAHIVIGSPQYQNEIKPIDTLEL